MHKLSVKLSPTSHQEVIYQRGRELQLPMISETIIITALERVNCHRWPHLLTFDDVVIVLGWFQQLQHAPPTTTLSRLKMRVDRVERLLRQVDEPKNQRLIITVATYIDNRIIPRYCKLSQYCNTNGWQRETVKHKMTLIHILYYANLFQADILSCCLRCQLSVVYFYIFIINRCWRHYVFDLSVRVCCACVPKVCDEHINSLTAWRISPNVQRCCKYELVRFWGQKVKGQGHDKTKYDHKVESYGWTAVYCTYIITKTTNHRNDHIVFGVC